MSENTTTYKKHSVEYVDIPLASGVLSIGVGDNISYNAAGFGKVTTDTAGEKFAGVSTQAVELSAAGNPANGTYFLRVIVPRSVNVVKRNIAATRAAALPGTKVYAKSAKEFALAGNVDGGEIFEFISTTECWVKI